MVILAELIGVNIFILIAEKMLRISCNYIILTKVSLFSFWSVKFIV